jgi:hypothetical protein
VEKPPADKPVRKHLNASEKRALQAADLQSFKKGYGRKAQKREDPNDRRGYDREFERKIRRMPPTDLDRLMRDDEE